MKALGAHTGAVDPSARLRPGAGAAVSFVGLGPGDAGLLTVRAVERLEQADVVVIDNACERARLLERHCSPTVRVLDASFGDDGQPLTLMSRAKLVVQAAAEGAQVVRLMEGDPSSFAGLAEEIKACRKAGLDFEIVPGVATATAVSAYAGVILGPNEAGQIHLLRLGAAEVDVDWSLHVPDDVTVVLSGTEEQVRQGVRSLLANGRSPATPAVIVADGASCDQRTISGPVAEVDCQAQGLAPGRQVVAVVGEPAVGALTNAWFETRPLFGWRVLVPRTKNQATSVTALLEAHGARSQVVPTIAVEQPRSSAQIDKAIVGLVTGRYAWVGFTSVNAVRAVREKLTALGLDARALAGVNIAAVGGVTAAALREWGVEPDLVPGGEVEQSAMGLLEVWPAFTEGEDPLDRVFLPRADIATETLVVGLTALGWQVDDVTAYRTVRAAPPPVEIREAIKGGQFDAVLFTSSSTVRNLIGIAGKPHAVTVVACIGPATAKTAQEHGLRVDVVAAEPSVEALVAALAEFGHGLRSAALEVGESVVRPSQRRAASRRRAK